MNWETVKEIFSSELVERVWDAFEIQVLVLVSLAFQVVLAICGSRRKYNTGIKIRFIVWFCYLMGTYVSTIALGKLTETNNNSVALSSISYGGANITNNELRATWAPLLLIHTGGPDSITAYAVEDNRLGWRQFLELGVQIGVVLLIFIKSWNNTWLSIIALTLLLAGGIKSFERVWAIRRSASPDAVFDTVSNTNFQQLYGFKSSNSDPRPSSSTNICQRFASNLRKRFYFKSSSQPSSDSDPKNTLSDTNLPQQFDFKSSVADLALLVKAYRRFEHLKPHLQNWIGQPLSMNFPSLSTYYYHAEHVFRITEFELGFMYDVLFTRFPTNYSVFSFIRRSICFLCLLSSLCGFAILFRYAKVELLQILVSKKYDKNVDIAITYVLLSGAIGLELYAIMNILWSDWAILFMIKERKNPWVQSFCQVLVRQVPMPWSRWSNCMEQLNLLEYCLYKEASGSDRIISKILKKKEWDQNFKRYRVTQTMQVPMELKKLIIEQIEQVRGQRVWQPFSKRGEWALERFKCVDLFKWSIQTDYTNEANQQTSFGRAITIWHIATHICDRQRPEWVKYSVMLSNYMMYLLAERPGMLSISTKQFLFQGACDKLTAFLDDLANEGPSDKDMINFFAKKVLEKGVEDLFNKPQAPSHANDIQKSSKESKDTEADIVLSWQVVLEAKILADLLLHRTDTWSLLNSVWVEMLCYAAYNCPWARHTQQLSQGGGLITHVWLLLNHETNMFNISMY